MRQVKNGAKIRVKLEALAQFDIDTGEPATNRRSHRTLQSNSRALDRFDQLSRNVFVIFLVGVSARLESLPFELQAGCFSNANGCLRDLGANTVAGNESDLVG